MKRTIIALAAVLLAAFTLHRVEAAPAAQEPTFIGEVNGVSLYSVNANGLRCVVTTPAGGISCK